MCVVFFFNINDTSFRLDLSCFPDGIYKITLGNRDIQTHCKFSAYGGGWTLLLTSASDNGWARDNLKSRNMGTPAMNLDFSILEMADKITNTKHFQVF